MTEAHTSDPGGADDAAPDASSPESGLGPGRSPASGGERSPRATLRKIGAWIGAVVAVLLLLYVAAALVLRALAPPERLAGWAEPRAETTLNRDVRIGGAELQIFPRLGVTLRDVRVGNLPNFEGPPVAELDRLHLRVGLLPLLRRRVVVDRAALDGLRLQLHVDEEGTSNFGDLVPAGGQQQPDEEAGGGQLPVSLSVRELVVSNALLEYRDRRDGRGIRLDSVRASVALEAGREEAWSVDAEASAAAMEARLPSLRDEPYSGFRLASELEARAGPDFGWLEIDRGRLSLNRMDLRLAGRVEDLGEPVRRLDLRLEGDSVRLGRLASALPAGTREKLGGTWRGRATLRLDVAGAVGEGRIPRAEGRLRLSDVGLTSTGGTPVADGIDGRVRVAGDTVRLEELEGTLFGGSLALQGRAVAGSVLPFGFQLRARPELAPLLALRNEVGGGGPPLDGGGAVEVNIRIAGQGSRPEATVADGTVTFRDVRLASDSLPAPLAIPRGVVTLSDGQVRWSELPLEIGDDRLLLSGSVERWTGGLAGKARPRIVGSVRSRRLDLARVLSPQPEEGSSYVELALARLGDRTVAGRSPAEVARGQGLVRPVDSPVVGELGLQIDTVDYEPYRLTSLRTRVVFTEDAVRIPDASVGLYGGEIQGNLSLELGEALEQPFSLSLSGRELEASEMLSRTSPDSGLMSGVLDFQLLTSGRLDSLLLPVTHTVTGKGRLALSDGRLRPLALTDSLTAVLAPAALGKVAFERWVVPFRIDGGAVRLDSARMASEYGDLTVDGLVGFDRRLDLAIRVVVPQDRVPALSLGRAGAARNLLTRLSAGDREVTLAFRARGTLDSPRVQLDTEALRGQAAGALKGAVEKQLKGEQEGGLKEKAKGVLNDLLGGGKKDTTPADTTTADTTRADTTGA